jgi:hypothetical protein
MSAIVDLDHLMVSVRSAQESGERFARMGFSVTPLSQLPGMANRLIVFPSPYPDRNNFIEFLALEDAGRAPAVMSDILRLPDRPASLVMASRDSRAAERVFAAKRLDPLPAMHFKRDWVLPDGNVASPEFIVCIVRPQSAPIAWNVCQYLNPEVYRRPEFVSHANTAERFIAALAVADDVQAVADYFCRAWDTSVEWIGEGALHVCAGTVPLRLYSPAAAIAHFPGIALPERASGAALLGFAVAVADMPRAQRHVASARMQARQQPGGFWIAPSAAAGCVVSFEPGAGPTT